MSKFRSKPKIIDAFQLETGFGAPKPQWFEDAVRRGDAWRPGAHWIIKTLEGEMRASLGDWIVRGIKGEIYPVKPDIFAETYEPVED